MAENRRGLGRGLSALLGEAAEIAHAGEPADGVREIPIELIHRNVEQPRQNFPEVEIEELATSIREKGILQPILVRPSPHAGGAYEIVAGERRWRAAQAAGLKTLPALVRELGDLEAFEIAVIENIQREDLNPMEAAAGYQRLVDEFHLKQDEIATQVGKDRATVANYLRLLKLPDEVRANVASGALSMGHARAIVALPTDNDQRRLARDVVSRGLSVRETEALVKGELGRQGPEAEKKPAAKKDVHVRAAEEQLRLSLGTPVEIKRRGKGGTIAITFTSETELQRLYEYLTETKSRT